MILFIDGFRGHLGVSIAKYCLENGIKLWLFPPNTTHILQPLDQAFGPVKKRIKTHSHTWHGTVKNIESGKKLDQYSMMTDCCYKAFEETFRNPNVISSAWRKCGLLPFDKNNVDFDKLNPSKMFTNSNSNNNDVSQTVSEPLRAASPPLLVADQELPRPERRLSHHDTGHVSQFSSPHVSQGPGAGYLRPESSHPDIADIDNSSRYRSYKDSSEDQGELLVLRLSDNYDDLE